MHRINCLRCDKPMQFIKRENVQLGRTGWLMGDWGNLLAGALDVAIFTCPECGKLEFYAPDVPEEDRIAQVACPECGREHDMDDAKCPFCGKRLQ